MSSDRDEGGSEEEQSQMEVNFSERKRCRGFTQLASFVFSLIGRRHAGQGMQVLVWGGAWSGQPSAV